MNPGKRFYANFPFPETMATRFKKKKPHVSSKCQYFNHDILSRSYLRDVDTKHERIKGWEFQILITLALGRLDSWTFGSFMSRPLYVHRAPSFVLHTYSALDCFPPRRCALDTRGTRVLIRMPGARSHARALLPSSILLSLSARVQCSGCKYRLLVPWIPRDRKRPKKTGTHIILSVRAKKTMRRAERGSIEWKDAGA